MQAIQKNKRRTIKRRLNRNLLFMLNIMVLITIAGLICIQILKNTGDKIAMEYHELNSVQELKFSFNKLMTPAYLLHTNANIFESNELQRLISSTKEDLLHCKQTLTKSHSKNQIHVFENHFNQVATLLIHFNSNEMDHMGNIQLLQLMKVGTHELESLLLETENEIDEFIITNKTAAYHSSIAISTLAVFLIFISSFWGSRFVIKISRNIKILARSTEKVAKGNLLIDIQIESNDEIGDLANSFNTMVKTLNETTISKNFFDNIMKSMVESLIVIDLKGKITLFNQASLDLLGYKEDDLTDQDYGIFLSEKGYADLNKILLPGSNRRSVYDQETTYRSKNNKEIPVLLSCTRMKNKEGEEQGIVFIAHDIKDKKQMEEQLRAARNEQIIAINEAQEKERLMIASEIHDGLGQILTGISFSIENNLIGKFSDDAEYKSSVLKIQDQLSDAIREAKSIAYNLIPIAIRDFGLVVAVDNFVQQINSVEKININFNVYNYKDRIDERLEKALFRIIQEALNNVLKHAEADTVNIQLVKYDDHISLVVEDDGKGFDYKGLIGNPKDLGIGLVSMRERVNAFDGVFLLNSAISKGTEILIEIPCKFRK